MTNQDDTLRWWEGWILVITMFFIYQSYKHKKGPHMTVGQKLGYGMLSFFGGCGAVIILNVALFCMKVFITAIFSPR